MVSFVLIGQDESIAHAICSVESQSCGVLIQINIRIQSDLWAAEGVHKVFFMFIEILLRFPRLSDRVLLKQNTEFETAG